jgi:aryl-alcohol dehydrogenase-like predicted oxidoreductase
MVAHGETAIKHPFTGARKASQIPRTRGASYTASRYNGSMDYTFMGKTGVRVSRLGFGTMSFGGDADRAVSAAIFARCRDAGINFFDCANVYNDGQAECILGDLVGPCRDEVVLTTKAFFPTGSDPNARGSTRYHLVRSVEASLKRLNTDRIDVFFLHRFDERTALEETLRAVEQLVQSGKILYPAVSNFAAWQVARALGVAERLGFAPVVAIQPMYNLVKRTAEIELLPMAQAEDLAVFPYSPLGGGLLSGKYSPTRKPQAGRLFTNKMYEMRYQAAGNFAVAEAMTELAKEYGVHPATLAVSWVAKNSAVTAPLLGARNLEQLEPLLAAATYRLPEELSERLERLTPAPPPATDRNDESTQAAYGAR